MILFLAVSRLILSLFHSICTVEIMLQQSLSAMQVLWDVLQFGTSHRGTRERVSEEFVDRDEMIEDGCKVSSRLTSCLYKGLNKYPTFLLIMCIHDTSVCSSI